MKVFGIRTIPNSHWGATSRQVRVVVAATSQTKAVEALQQAGITNMTVNHLRNYGAVTSNPTEVEVAHTSPARCSGPGQVHRQDRRLPPGSEEAMNVSEVAERDRSPGPGDRATAGPALGHHRPAGEVGPRLARALPGVAHTSAEDSVVPAAVHGLQVPLHRHPQRGGPVRHRLHLLRPRRGCGRVHPGRVVRATGTEGRERAMSDDNDNKDEIKVGDSVVARNGERGLRWRVTAVGDGLVTAERKGRGTSRSWPSTAPRHGGRDDPV